MFNPEKLLGGLLKQSTGMGRLGTRAAVGMGVLGAAMAAAEHFMNKPGQTPTGKAPPGPPAGGPPPAPPQAQRTPPPVPGTNSPPPPPGRQGDSPPQSEDENGAILLLRAMISSANADGTIDQDERRNIMKKLDSLDLSREEREFIDNELASPCDLETVVGQVKSKDIAKQVYAVSLMAIEVDTDAERNYLKSLADRLKLNQDECHLIHRELGVMI